MRLSIVASVAALILAATLASSAGAARKPTPSERAAITLAAIEGIPHIKGMAAIFIVRSVVMSTVKPGSNSSFSSFGAAFGVAKDQSGLFPTGPRIALVGRHRRTLNWITVGYGVSRVLCHEPQSFFGGRRAAILRDLGIRCPQGDQTNPSRTRHSCSASSTPETPTNVRRSTSSVSAVAAIR